MYKKSVESAKPRITLQEIAKLSSVFHVGHGNAKTGDTRNREMPPKREQMEMEMPTVVTAKKLTPT